MKKSVLPKRFFSKSGRIKALSRANRLLVAHMSCRRACQSGDISGFVPSSNELFDAHIEACTSLNHAIDASIRYDDMPCDLSTLRSYIEDALEDYMTAVGRLILERHEDEYRSWQREQWEKKSLERFEKERGEVEAKGGEIIFVCEHDGSRKEFATQSFVFREKYKQACAQHDVAKLAKMLGVPSDATPLSHYLLMNETGEKHTI